MREANAQTSAGAEIDGVRDGRDGRMREEYSRKCQASGANGTPSRLQRYLSSVTLAMAA